MDVYEFIQAGFNDYDYDRLKNMNPECEDSMYEDYETFLQHQLERVKQLSEEKLGTARTLMSLCKTNQIKTMDKECMCAMYASGFYISADGKFIVFCER